MWRLQWHPTPGTRQQQHIVNMSRSTQHRASYLLPGDPGELCQADFLLPDSPGDTNLDVVRYPLQSTVSEFQAARCVVRWGGDNAVILSKVTTYLLFTAHHSPPPGFLASKYQIIILYYYRITATNPLNARPKL